ncbi:YrhK family protein [Gordonia shandongensis]|uniref:YrhK family protein n=1 Tax=Gordonia shandongensis TaxID=376351 RepID=UPI0004272950|nr:YrhK family protein [Gordonia shandongensis]
MTGAEDRNRTLVVRLGREEIIIRRRYEALSIANDVLIGVWFLIGSFLFFSDDTVFAGTWLFVIGSVEMLIRPVIRLVRHVHLQRLAPEPAVESDGDF